MFHAVLHGQRCIQVQDINVLCSPGYMHIQDINVLCSPGKLMLYISMLYAVLGGQRCMQVRDITALVGEKNRCFPSVSTMA